MLKDTIKTILLDQNDIDIPKSYTARHIEDDLIRLMANPSILIITGLRRCGKSVMLQWLRTQHHESSYFVNFDDDRFATFTVNDFQALYECLLELYKEQSTFYFDEIQNIPEWERFVRRLHNEHKKVIITGSNASMLSRELGTKLTGRYVAIEMFPYDFKEYLTSQNISLYNKTAFSTKEKAMLKRRFDEYSKIGGMPEYVKYQDDEYIRGIYTNILYRDIIVRHNIKSENTIRELVYYLASNNAKDTSFNKLKNLLNVKATNSIGDYCRYLEDCYLCAFINRYDRSLKSQMGYAKKVYFIDPAISRLIGFRDTEDSGRMLENLVFNHLRKKYQTLFLHRDETECDFLVKEGSTITQAIQVTKSLDHEKTRTREIKGLIAALKTYDLPSGIILTENESGEEVISHQDKSFKVTIMPIWLWMLKN